MKELCNKIAVSGYEEYFILDIKNELSKYCDDIYIDSIGNLVCHRKGQSDSSKKFMVAAHVDEVGLQIQRIEGDKLYFKVLGNIKCKNLLHQRVQFENGVLGVVYCEAESFENYDYGKFYIKTLEETSQLEIGDVATFEKNYCETEDYICTKALDNRAGVHALMELVKSDITYHLDTYIVFTVQEEIGLKGNQVAIHAIRPDYFLSVDASAVNDHNNIAIGAGVAVKVSDSISVCDRKLVAFTKNICKEKNIKYQLEVSDCGSSEIALVTQSEHSFRSLAISYPAMEIHTSQTLMSKRDWCEMKHLLFEFIMNF